VTVAIVTGWLLTVANAGDSMAILDTPKGIKEMVASHRIQENTTEQDRLRAAHAQIAPLGFHLQGPAKPEELGVGPLRLWPGGLCVSRSVGDLDAGALVVPVPHIKQVRCLLAEACKWRVPWGVLQAG
jgi:serine/threonine protein phosphatase PrpC